jgi:xanthine dehydrogenase accessory factor
MQTGDILLIRGGGDLASGVAVRLRRVGLQVVITELPQPLAVRRRVAFAEAVYAGVTRVEEVVGRRVEDANQTWETLASGEVAVWVDPEAKVRGVLPVGAIVDGRMSKKPPEPDWQAAPLVVGLGPGFVAGENCHAAIETNRGPDLGRVLWRRSPEADTGIPGELGSQRALRVLRAPAAGILTVRFEIGERVQEGETIAEVDGKGVAAPFSGVLRGMLRSGFQVWQGLKVGDLDPRDDPRLCFMVSEKSLAVAGGVLEALLTRADIRVRLWG